MEKATGATPPELDAPPLPWHLEYLWLWFVDLSNARTAGMSINPITYEAIRAWSELTGNILAPWEVATIKALDAVFLSEAAKD